MESFLFQDVKFTIHRSIKKEDVEKLMAALDANGATEAEVEREATHIITDSLEVGIDMETDGKRIHLVTPAWVTRCMALGIRQEERFYSPDPKMLFSGIVGCASDLPARDVEVIQAGIVGLGGQWRGPLTKEVTHLFVLSPNGEKYNIAMKHQHRTGMKVVLPHWFDDSFKAAHLVPTRMYEFPDPPLMKPGGSQIPEPWKYDENQSQLYKSIQYAKADQDMSKIRAKQKDMFGNQRVLLSDSLRLTSQRREAFESRIRDAGGVIAESVSKADILVTALQDGHEFYSAFKRKKTVGTLEWLVYALRDGRLSNPREQLMHFPHPKGPCGNFATYEMTVTNYTGPARDYVKLLIEALGAKFTPTMSGSTTHVIAGYCPPNEKVSAKIERAEEWKIPVVNHLWLEDCFVDWKESPVSGNKYAMRNIEWSAILGAKREITVNIPKEEQAESESETEAEVSPQKSRKSAQHNSAQSTPTRKLNGRHHATDADALVGGTAPQPEEEDEVDEMVGTDNAATPTHRTARPLSKTPLFHPEMPTGRIVPATSSPMRPEDTPPSSKRQAVSSPDKSEPPTKRTKINSQAPANTPVVEISSDSEKGQVQKPSLKSSSTRPKPRPLSRTLRMPSPTSDSELPDDPMEGLETKATRKAPSKRVISTSRTVAKPLPSSALTEDEDMSDAPGPSRGRVPPPKQRKGKRPSSPASGVELLASDGPSSSAIASTSWDNRPRRSAAVAAEKSLHIAMEDANKFSKEMRHGHHLNDLGRIKVPAPEVVTLTTDDSADERPPMHPKEVEHKRGRGSREARENTPVAKKPLKEGVKVGPPRKKRAVVSDDDAESEEVVHVQHPKKPTAPKANANAKSTKKAETPPAKQVKAIATQINLTSAEQRALEALGVIMVSDARECTHVIAKGISRTEKFLVAMANAPKIVTKDWVTKSIEAERLLPEREYAVKDTAKEHDYDFKLSDALARAAKKPLMQGHKFHITPTVKVDFQSLKKIIEACGGKVQKVQQPLTKELEDNQHIISCVEDEKYWKPLATAEEGTRVYSQELILTGALKQEMAWEDRTMLVAVSSA